MGQLMTEDEWYDKVRKLGGGEYIPMEEYTNRRTKILMHHKVCKREYLVLPSGFLNGNMCPLCYSGKYKIPTQLEFEQHILDITSGELIVEGQYRDAATKVRLRHTKCGNILYIRPNDIISKGRMCRYCNGGVRKDYEDLVNVVDKKLGEQYKLITNADEYANSKSKISVLHRECNRVYKTTRNDIIQGHKCNLCNSTDAKTPEKYLEEFNNIAKGQYELLSSYTRGKDKITVKSNLCGHIFKVTAVKFLSGTRCTKCRQSTGEKIIKDYLVRNNINFYSQYIVYINTIQNRFDFFLPDYNAMIEFDGIQHFEPVAFFGGLEELKNRQHRDKLKNDYCNTNNINLIRIDYTEIESITDILNKELEVL